MEQPHDYYERKRMPLRVTINAPKRLLSLTVTQSQSLPFLPDELIREILLRLPARSLLRLRRVCSSWKSLISSSQFAKDHLQHSTAADPSLSGPRVAYHHFCHYGFGDFSLRSLIENSSKPTEVVLFEERRNYKVIGSCNGLLCLLFNDAGINTCVRLWNPCTGLLTTPSVECGDFLSDRGFGYDHVNDKYKLVVIVKQRRKYTTRIYTFCSNPSKRAIQGIPFRSINGDGKGVFVPGTATLNWIRRDAILGCLVFSLDLVKETFSEFSLPLNDPDDKTYIFLRLCVLRNCLAYCFNHETHWFVWVMKEYGVPKSWTKLAIIPCHPRLSNYCFRPLYIWGNNILVAVALTSKIVLFNLDNGSFEFPVLKPTPSIRWSVFIYHESLVSPPYPVLPISSSQIQLIKR
ncbi:hypothetical protein HN51_053520 [Arachis hypogaea]|uniref:F-box domain-containing protein n=1 Tax=Arachis hypogaea TaxID=3818 RepID=A0A444XCF3_ARAHY|nr:F-box/kelch-repeat protein At3g23880-like [Arachis ipaensis]XP_020967941.1 F-box/kelch-repeat protein At3g23880-like [Arachis ipaensis]XP_029151317.1 F-box/kelch-repeat protein At3g23880 [Arachis hypogaea]XP_029151318.1 F-box/kelch-repeat protein At3g23880 [Arachis hypogaea]RYQ87389.1 hypothetical protein Ahy_B09g094904 [Arachis hypogaea]